jgi:hypothetical protein
VYKTVRKKEVKKYLFTFSALNHGEKKECKNTTPSGTRADFRTGQQKEINHLNLEAVIPGNE